jgi:hypothetical protein
MSPLELIWENLSSKGMEGVKWPPVDLVEMKQDVHK